MFDVLGIGGTPDIAGQGDLSCARHRRLLGFVVGAVDLRPTLIMVPTIIEVSRACRSEMFPRTARKAGVSVHFLHE
jgi:hypothetical protein